MRISAIRMLLLLVVSIPGLRIQAASYYSRQDGQYDVSASWSNVSHSGSAAASSPCNCTPCTVGGSINLEIAHALTISCDLSYFGNPNVTVQSGGSLTVAGNANVSGSVIFTVDSGATVYISGNFLVSGGGGSVNINGNLIIGGNLTIVGGYPVCGIGTLSIGGSVSGFPCGTLTLPVTWLNVRASVLNESIHVGWQTASEINNDYFTVEKSHNGIQFTSIGQIDGSGNSTSLVEYNFTDPDPSGGRTYYRISQTDFDGTTDHSETVTVYFKRREPEVFIKAPDNGSDHVSICFNGMKDFRVEINLYDLHGVLLKHQQLRPNAEQVTIEYRPPGNLLYNLCLISIRSEQLYISKKLLISK